VSITCIDCTASGDFSISGGCHDFNCVPDLQPDANFSSLPFNFEDYWLGVVIEDFTARFDLSFSVTPTGPSNEVTIPLMGDGLGLDLSVRYSTLA
jgi:hypothetical protein